MFKNIKQLSSILLFTILIDGCAPVETGFLSNNLYYIENPFIVKQGVTTVSSSLVADGSTMPLSVKLLGITNKESGEAVDSVFLKARDLIVFSQPITFADSSVESVRLKLKDSTVAPFSINPKGGRLQFTANTTYIPEGTYAMDISVSNVRGTKVLKDACDITITPTEYFLKGGTEYGYLLDTISFTRTYTSPIITMVRDVSGPSQIVIKWVDEDGKVFNPAAGQVLARPGLASFKNWDPYYKTQLTDTAFVFQYPENLPTFPIFNPAYVGPSNLQGDYWCYYRIPAHFIKETNQEYRTGFSFYFPNAVGTYIVTIKEVGAHKR